MKILVVDDSRAVRTFVRNVLEEALDCSVIDAASGFDALRMLPREDFNLVITDINMPDINGLDLIRFIRKSSRYERVPVVIISTQSSEKSQERFLTLGANCFIAKPFTPETLSTAVATLLAERPGSALPVGDL